MDSTTHLWLQVEAGPKFVSIFQIKFYIAFANCQVDFQRKSLLQVPEEAPEVDSEKGNGKCSIQGSGTDKTFKLFVLRVNHTPEQESSLEHREA